MQWAFEGDLPLLCILSVVRTTEKIKASAQYLSQEPQPLQATYCTAGNSVGSGARKNLAEGQLCHLLADFGQVAQNLSLFLGFFICKMEISNTGSQVWKRWGKVTAGSQKV